MGLLSTTRSRLAAAAATTLAYALAGVPLAALLGPGAGSLAAIPVALVAALLGWRAGVALALACIPLVTLHLNLAGHAGWDAGLRGGGAGFVALVAVGGAIGWLRDLLAKLRARGAALGAIQATLRASEARLAEAERLAHLGGWEYDPGTGAIGWSDEAYRLLGFDPGAFAPTAERFAAALHPDDRARVLGALRACAEAGTPFDEEFRIVRPDGAARTLHARGEPRPAPGHPSRLVGFALDVTERKELERRLAHQATHDPLTGLPNRALLLDRIGRALERARRTGRPCAVLFLDLDRFKEVNDTLGHDVGDRLLVAVAGRLRRVLREGDTLARLGGDEFALMAEGATGGEAAGVAARVLGTLEPPLALDGQDLALGGSVGIALSRADHARPEDLLRDADVAMYRAKAAGGGFALFDPAMRAAIAARVALERDLRAALERGEFALHYQPIVDLATGRIAKAEALARWRHPERGLVAPGGFIPLAEETGLIVPLGRWVLAEACRQARAWEGAGTPLVVAVNLTAREFGHPALVGEIAAALAAAGLDARWLRLELTESLAMRDTATTVATLAALRAQGVQIAIDDFGTGHSSLAYLRRLPVDTLKIDRAFVDGLGRDEAGTALAAAIIGLGHTLGLRVVAEGVETAAQVSHLRALECDLAQGYHFARPLPAGELTALLAAGAPLGDSPPAPIHRDDRGRVAALAARDIPVP